MAIRRWLILLTAAAGLAAGQLAMSALAQSPAQARQADPSRTFDAGLDAYHQMKFAEAERLYRLAAEEGDVAAQVNLGNMYAYGDGVPKNLNEAVKWYRRAADQGDSAGRQLLDNLLNDIETMKALNRQ